MILKLIDTNGQEEDFKMRDPLASVVSHLQLNDVETIVVGEVDGEGNVTWEKRFNLITSITVMPAEFVNPK